MLACGMAQEAAAAELLEATKKAGALDLQVTEQTWCVCVCVCVREVCVGDVCVCH